jgi:hypothetical protein
MSIKPPQQSVAPNPISPKINPPNLSCRRGRLVCGLTGLLYHRSNPLEVTAFPNVSEANKQNTEEHQNVSEPNPPQLKSVLGGNDLILSNRCHVCA